MIDDNRLLREQTRKKALTSRGKAKGFYQIWAHENLSFKSLLFFHKHFLKRNLFRSIYFEPKHYLRSFHGVTKQLNTFRHYMPQFYGHYGVRTIQTQFNSNENRSIYQELNSYLFYQLKCLQMRKVNIFALKCVLLSLPMKKFDLSCKWTQFYFATRCSLTLFVAEEWAWGNN